MIYKRSLQKKFVSGMYTPAVLMVVALALWGCNAFIVAPTGDSGTTFFGPLSGTYLSSFLTLFFYVVPFFVLRSLDLFENRLRFMPALFMLFAVSFPLPNDCVHAFTLLLFMLAVAQIFRAQQCRFAERILFSSFALLACASLLQPQALLLFAPFLAFMFYSNLFSIKHMLSAMLGALMPFWFAFGIAYVFPSAKVLLAPFMTLSGGFFSFVDVEISYMLLLLAAFEALVYIPAIMKFTSSSIPAKPQLRRRMIFVITMNLYLLVLSALACQSASLFYLWRLPGLAILCSYVISFKFTKLTNLYFILLNIVVLAVAIYNLCLIV